MSELRVLSIGTSLTSAGRWQPAFCAGLAAAMPGRTITHVNRGIGGAGSDIGALNIAHYIAADPSLVVMEWLNDCHTAKQITVNQALANWRAITAALRAAVPGVKILWHTVFAPREPNVTIRAPHAYYDEMVRVFASPAEPERPDFMFHGAPHWRVISDFMIETDGVHPKATAWALITPLMLASVLPQMAGHAFRTPASAMPPAVWTHEE